jgi:hypothetical protein
MRLYPYILLALLLLPTGCASNQTHPIDSLQQILKDEEAQLVGAPLSEQTAAPLPKQGPPKLGLYVMPTGFLHHKFEWTDADRETLQAWTNGLQREGLISGASFLHLSSVKGNPWAQLRESATRYGADLLLIVNGAAAVDRYNNYKGTLLYWTILGSYYADGTHSDALCLVRSSLWDVRTGTKLAEEEAQGTAKVVGPSGRIEDQDQITEARRQALAQLMKKLRDDMIRIGRER